jgi:hypothetical protein
MMILSISGVFKMILMIIGGFVLLRFVGQLLIAKRNMEEERRINEQERKFRAEQKEKLKTFGKTKIIKNKDVKGDVQDVDYEEIQQM